MSPLLLQSIMSFFTTLMGILILARVAPALGLIDKPSERKRHEGERPVVGGLGLFLALSLAGIVWGHSNQTLITVNGNDALWIFMACGAFLVVAGALDDRFRLGVFARALSEVLIAVAIIEFLGLRLVHLGDIAGIGIIKISPLLSYPFTVIVIFGVINAFNMLDGMDGLLGLLVLTTLVSFHVFTGTAPGFVSVSVGSSLLAFLVSNLKLSRFIPKTFLGDAGSKLLGFIVVCLLLAAASAQVGDRKLIQPVTALFIVALPLFDMFFTSLRRILRKGSPFAADRSHIHHLMQDLGLSGRRALAIILSIQLGVAVIGLMLHRVSAPEYYQFAIFLSCLAVYGLLTGQLWRVAASLDTVKPLAREQIADADDRPTGETADSKREDVTSIRDQVGHRIIKNQR